MLPGIGDADGRHIQQRQRTVVKAAAVPQPVAGTIEGDDFSLADIALGAYARRWFGVEGVSKPALAHLERWFGQFAGRPGFDQFVAPPMS